MGEEKRHRMSFGSTDRGVPCIMWRKQEDYATLKARLQKMRWRKVSEELPADSSPVIAFYINGCGKGRRVRASYISPRSEEVDLDFYESDDVDYDEERDVYWLPEMWCEENENEDNHWRIIETVTHWMPLPDSPPQPKEAADEAR